MRSPGKSPYWLGVTLFALLSSCGPSNAPSDMPGASGSLSNLEPECEETETLRSTDGKANSCYPYRCRDGQCLHRCVKAEEDCAPFAQPGESFAKGWPLDCVISECVPLPPRTVEP